MPIETAEFNILWIVIFKPFRYGWIWKFEELFLNPSDIDGYGSSRKDAVVYRWRDIRMMDYLRS